MSVPSAEPLRQVTDDEVARFVADGVCEVEDRTVRLTDVGRPLVRLVAAAFDAFLDWMRDRAGDLETRGAGATPASLTPQR